MKKYMYVESNGRLPQKKVYDSYITFWSLERTHLLKLERENALNLFFFLVPLFVYISESVNNKLVREIVLSSNEKALHKTNESFASQSTVIIPG